MCRPRSAIASLGCLACAALLLGCAEPRWNLLLVTFDTTRADHLGPYGSDLAATPTLDALAAAGIVFDRAYAAVPITLPSHTTIMTGVYPPHHGVRDNGLFVVPPEVETLAERLRAAGYRTAAAVGAFPLERQFGLDQGFELYDDHVTREYEDLRGRRIREKEGMFFDERDAQRVNEAIGPWLEAHRDEPFFAWVHYYDPHHPLDPPSPYDQLYGHDPYAGEIAYADESLGTLFAHLERLGVWDRTLVVFTADHGEGLGEHREATHSLLLYNTTLHVPLILRLPGAAGGGGAARVGEQVSHVDLVPTLLELLGLPPAAGLDGRSLVPYLRGEHPVPPPHYAETLSPRLGHGWGELRAILAGEWKLVHGPRSELFHLPSDPRELDNRIADEPEVARGLEQRLRGLLRDVSVARPQQAAAPGAETRRRLEALGYIQAGGGESVEIREELIRDGAPPQDRVHRTSDLSRIKDLLVRQQPLAAKEIIERLAAEDPESPYYMELLARTDLALGQVEEATAVLERLVTTSGGSAGAGRLLVDLGRHLLRLGRLEEARAQLERGVELEPVADAWFLLGTVAEELGDEERARVAFEQAVAEDASHGPALVALAIRRARQGETDAAERLFLQAIDRDPYYPRGHFNYGAFLTAAGRAAEAVARFERAIDLDPGYLQAYDAATATLRALGRGGEADALAARRPAAAAGPAAAGEPSP